MSRHYVSGRAGHMDGDNYVADQVRVAFEHESGLVGVAVAATEEEALAAAKADAEAQVADHAEWARLAVERGREDPLSRLRRLEAIVKKHGLS